MTTITYAPFRTLSTTRRLSLSSLRGRRQAKALREELAMLRRQHNGLVADILDHGIEYGEILEIRNNYLKELTSAPLKKFEDPVSRLELYKRLTKKYHNQFVASRILYAGHADIAPLRATENLIASITYRLIDLSNTDKNQFVRTMKRVREIERELRTIK